MVERGQREKERRDKHAREEDLAIGMKVLLKNRIKRKGQPKYDPKPYTITGLKGRQATLQRGERKIRRETQKFKRFFEPARPTAEAGKTIPDSDDWEDRRKTDDSAKQRRGGKEKALTAPGNTTVLIDNQTDDVPDPETNNVTRETDGIALATDNTAPEADNAAPETDNTGPETDNIDEADQNAHPAAENRPQATDGRRTSHRERRPRDMYGDWDTSKRREYTRR